MTLVIKKCTKKDFYHILFATAIWETSPWPLMELNLNFSMFPHYTSKYFKLHFLFDVAV